MEALDKLPQIYSEYAEGGGFPLNLELYPGLAFAKALVLFDREEDKKRGDTSHTESSAQLLRAILRFPHVIPELGEKLGINVPKELLENKRSSLRLSFEWAFSF